MKVREIMETTSGGIATVSAPLGGTIKRGNPSIYPTVSKSKKKYANSVKAKK